MIAIIYAINALLAFFVLRYEFYSESDKTIIITSALIVILIAINLVAGLIFQLRKKPYFQHFYLCGLLLLVTTVVALFLW
jgi:hypothetical protein